MEPGGRGATPARAGPAGDRIDWGYKPLRLLGGDSAPGIFLVTVILVAATIAYGAPSPVFSDPADAPTEATSSTAHPQWDPVQRSSGTADEDTTATEEPFDALDEELGDAGEVDLGELDDTLEPAEDDDASDDGADEDTDGPSDEGEDPEDQDDEDDEDVLSTDDPVNDTVETVDETVDETTDSDPVNDTTETVNDTTGSLTGDEDDDTDDGDDGLLG